MKALLSLILVMTLAALASGCAAVWARKNIDDAGAAVAAAETADAPRHAPYEYWRAKLQLEEAKYKEGYAEYHTAARLASEAEEFAGKARVKALNKSQKQKESAPPGDAAGEVPEAPPKSPAKPSREKRGQP
ncbi:MAG: hypothetical protein GMKNLPBB_00121 [Myxococcota bacterium]|nr:hypothetical protein [Myxococcota bacterium]